MADDPMETMWKPMPAPKFVGVLVAYDDGLIRLIDADENEYDWRPYSGKKRWLCQPTHWMPLPAPPVGACSNTELAKMAESEANA